MIWGGLKRSGCIGVTQREVGGRESGAENTAGSLLEKKGEGTENGNVQVRESRTAFTKAELRTDPLEEIKQLNSFDDRNLLITAENWEAGEQRRRPKSSVYLHGRQSSVAAMQLVQ